MRKVNSYVCLLVFFLGCLSCKKGLNKTDYVNYVNKKENGLKKTIEIDGLELSMQYRPYDYITLMENKGDLYNYDLKKRMSELKGTAWFSITLKRADYQSTPLRYGISSNEEYNERLNYYLNDAKKDIRLLYGDDTLQPVSYLFENNYNLIAQETMVVGFYLPAGEEYPRAKMELSYNDQVFKSGIVKATYTEQSLKNIPNVVY